MIWCYLLTACFDLKIGFFQQTVVRVYYILNMLYHDGSAKFIYQSKSKKFQMRNIFCLKTELLLLHPNEFLIVLYHLALFIWLSFTCYLITCIRCSLQNIGETSRKINARFNWHKIRRLPKTLNISLLSDIIWLFPKRSV